METFEDQYLDVLHNIESALAGAYREYEDMTDFETLNAVNGLIRTYTAQQRRRPEPVLNLNPMEQFAYDAARVACDWRLGSDAIRLETAEGEPVELEIEPLTVGEIIACLKRIRKSAQLWQKEGGRRGYYEFVSRFLP
jgi:hypothetical protein